jgi:hypothetical protein
MDVAPKSAVTPRNVGTFRELIPNRYFERIPVLKAAAMMPRPMPAEV